jgi:hypothetical protein
MTDNLKPCPFCGADGEGAEGFLMLCKDEVGFRVQCIPCMAVGPEVGTSLEARKRWNAGWSRIEAETEGGVAKGCDKRASLAADQLTALSQALRAIADFKPVEADDRSPHVQIAVFAKHTAQAALRAQALA